MTYRVAFAANPRSGAGRGRRAVEFALPVLAAAADVRDVTGENAASTAAALADALDAGVDAVARTGTALGIVAAGTGNDIARELGLPLDPRDAAVAVVAGLRSGSRRRVDAVRCTLDDGRVRWFAGVLAAGFDAVVNERANGWAWPRGRARYALAVARELPVFRERRYVLDLDGDIIEVPAMLIAVANAPAYGGGMRISPKSVLDDGLLDVVVAGPISRLELVLLFPRVFSGRHVDHPRVRLYRARCLRVDAPVDSTDDPPVESGRIIGYADGERFGPLPLTCQAVPGALTLIV